MRKRTIHHDHNPEHIDVKNFNIDFVQAGAIENFLRRFKCAPYFPLGCEVFNSNYVFGWLNHIVEGLVPCIVHDDEVIEPGTDGELNINRFHEHTIIGLGVFIDTQIKGFEWLGALDRLEILFVQKWLAADIENRNIMLKIIEHGFKQSSVDICRGRQYCVPSHEELTEAIITDLSVNKDYWKDLHIIKVPDCIVTDY